MGVLFIQRKWMVLSHKMVANDSLSFADASILTIVSLRKLLSFVE